MKWLEAERRSSRLIKLMCLCVLFFHSSSTTPVNTDPFLPKLDELQKKLSDLEDGVKLYREQLKPPPPTSLQQAEAVASLMTPQDKQLVDLLVARMKFLQTKGAAKTSQSLHQSEGNGDNEMSAAHQDVAEGQFQFGSSRLDTGEGTWADHVIDEAQLGVDTETPKCTDEKCFTEKARALLELERKLLAALSYARSHRISVSQLLDTLQSAKSRKKMAADEEELALLPSAS